MPVMRAVANYTSECWKNKLGNQDVFKISNIGINRPRSESSHPGEACAPESIVLSMLMRSSISDIRNYSAYSSREAAKVHLFGRARRFVQVRQAINGIQSVISPRRSRWRLSP